MGKGTGISMSELTTDDKIKSLVTTLVDAGKQLEEIRVSDTKYNPFLSRLLSILITDLEKCLAFLFYIRSYLQ